MYGAAARREAMFNPHVSDPPPLIRTSITRPGQDDASAKIVSSASSSAAEPLSTPGCAPKLEKLFSRR